MLASCVPMPHPEARGESGRIPRGSSCVPYPGLARAAAADLFHCLWPHIHPTHDPSRRSPRRRPRHDERRRHRWEQHDNCYFLHHSNGDYDDMPHVAVAVAVAAPYS